MILGAISMACMRGVVWPAFNGSGQRNDWANLVELDSFERHCLRPDTNSPEPGTPHQHGLMACIQQRHARISHALRPNSPMHVPDDGTFAPRHHSGTMITSTGMQSFGLTLNPNLAFLRGLFDRQSG
jgi:hypothetical protein